MTHLSDLPLFALSQEPLKAKFLTVSELTSQIKATLEPPFQDLWVKGEVSNFRPAASGHIYFSLKDAQANLACAIFNWSNRKKKLFELKDGLEIVCKGKISLYPPRGSYQLIVEHIEPLGIGALQLAFEQLKEKLNKEGLFDIQKKKPIPPFPQQIAIITSPSGAAIQDILTILKRRAPGLKVLIIPAVVQGEDAPSQLTKAIETANHYKLGEVIFLTRGGGSIEDLWCFNDENLARAIAKSQLPIVSAVGHEIDFTIADFVSDLRAPTPSAAAEIISHGWFQGLKQALEAQERIEKALLKELFQKKTLLTHIAARLVNPKDKLREQAQRTDEVFLRLCRAIQIKIERKKNGWAQFSGQLNALSPLKVLERGYTLVKDTENQIIRSIKEIKAGMELEITFSDGQKKVQAL